MAKQNLWTVDRDHELGVGGFGQVCKGQFQGNSVAVKRIELIRLQRVNGDRELEIMKTLDHPNILKLLHWEDANEFRYLIVELCDGTLMDIISGKYKGPVPKDSQCLMHMAAGVGYLHSRKVVHRDIKPENVLIYCKQPSDPVLKIADFGLSKRTTGRGSFSMSAVGIGTLHYMAPELLQLMNKGEEEIEQRVSNASDVFALGCVYFIYLSRGTHPFGSDYRTLNNIVEGNFDLSKLKRGHFAYNLIQRMIQTDPKKRPLLPKINEQLATSIFIDFPPSLEGRRCYKRGDEGDVIECKFHPSSQKLACALESGRVCIFTGTSTSFFDWQKTTFRCDVDTPILSIDWNMDGSQLAAGSSDGTLVIWDEDGAIDFEDQLHSGQIIGLKWNKFEKGRHLLLSISDDQTLIVWSSARQEAIRSIYIQGDCVQDVCWTSVDVFAYCNGDNGVALYRISQFSTFLTYGNEHDIRQLKFNDVDELIIYCTEDEGYLKVWSFEEELHTLERDESRVLCFDWHRSSQQSTIWIAGGCDDSKVAIWKLTGSDHHRATIAKILKGHDDAIDTLAFSPDGRLLSSLDASGKMIIWCTQDWRRIFTTQVIEPTRIYELCWDKTSTKLAIPNESDNVWVVNVKQK